MVYAAEVYIVPAISILFYSVKLLVRFIEQIINSNPYLYEVL